MQLRKSGVGNTIARGALLTVGTLFGGLIAGLLAGSIVFHLIPGSSVENVRIGHAAIAAIPALAGFLLGGAAWGTQMGRLAGAEDTRRLAVAGLLGFGPVTILLALGLGAGEPLILAAIGDNTPIHRIFTLLFVPSAFLIAGISAYALGRGLGDKRLALSLLWRTGLAAAVTFLCINLLMESLGWVVGAPGAGERATMLTVMFAGNLGAALVGGGLLALTLREAYQPGVIAGD
jgi:hypothetical protein